MALLIPLIYFLQCISIRLTNGHALGLFIGDIVGDSTINVNEKIFFAGRKLRTYCISGSIESAFKILIWKIHEAKVESNMKGWNFISSQNFDLIQGSKLSKIASQFSLCNFASYF